MKMRMGNRVRVGALLTLPIVATLILVMVYATPALSQGTSAVRVSNLDEPADNDLNLFYNFNQGHAQSFCTGDDAFTLDKVRLYTRSYEAYSSNTSPYIPPAPVVTIRSDWMGVPGPVLHTLTDPHYDASLDTAEDFTSSGFELAANTTYWVAVYRPQATGLMKFRLTRSPDQETGIGWGLGDGLLKDVGNGWEPFEDPYLIKMAVHATGDVPTISTPAFPDFDCDGTINYELQVNENTAPNTVVGTAVAGDPDGDSLTYSLGGTDAAKFNEVFALNTSTGEITVKPGASIDYDLGKRAYSVNVSVTDGEDASGAAESEATTDATLPVSIEVINVDEPGIITLSTTALSPRVGSPLSVSLDDPDGGERVYGIWWFRGSGADGPFIPFLPYSDHTMREYSYTPTAADKYKFIKVRMLYVDDLCLAITSMDESCRKSTETVLANAVANEDGLIAARQVSNTPATGNVRITGTPRIGLALRVVKSNIRDADGTLALVNHQVTYSYQWVRVDLTTLVEENVPTLHEWEWNYLVSEADAGRGIMVRVSFTDDAGTTETLSSAVISIPAQPNNVATGSPTIGGTVRVGETLSVDTSGISDADSIVNSTLIYQWIANDGTEDTDIQDAAGSTYTLGADDEGKTIKVRVSFIDGARYQESLTSEPTETVEAQLGGTPAQQQRSDTPATGTPGISGTPQAGQTLTATTSDIQDEDGLENAKFGYQWLRMAPGATTEEDIEGASGSTYTVTDADAGKAIRVRVSFTDDAGNEESLTSDAVAASPAPVIPDEEEDDEQEVEEEQEEEETPRLTASFSGVPTSHDGSATFTFELRFSEEFPISYITLRDHAFTVTGGEVTGARRLEPGKNVRWEITVQPSGNADLNVLLPVTTDCSSQGAICPGGDRKLSGSVEFTVSGPGAQQQSDNQQPQGTLTASAHDAPASHDGLNSFTFELRFSEEFSISYITLRDHAFTVTGGEVTGARRLEPGRNVRWQVTALPSGNADVTVVLPVSIDCTSQGAICTEDDRKMSSRVKVTLTGPDV